MGKSTNTTTKKENQKRKASAKFFGKKTRFFWAFYILGALGVLLGVALLPLWQSANVFWKDWGGSSITIILMVLLTLYLILYLARKFALENIKTVKIITAIEFLISLILIILCFLQQLSLISFIGPCLVFGVVLWLRGVNYVVKAYLYQHKQDEQPYPLYILIIAIILISLGAFFASNSIEGSHFMWIASIGIILVSIFSIIYGFIVIPKKDGPAKAYYDPAFEDDLNLNSDDE